ncbi:cupin domain-containing protein [Thermoproteota archaeon]
MISIIDLAKVVESLSVAWSPVDIAYVNDQVVRLALFYGTYHWHKHDTEDELFYVHKGSIRINIKQQDSVQLSEGQFCVIPKGIEHKPESENPSIVLLFEPFKLKSRGD